MKILKNQGEIGQIYTTTKYGKTRISGVAYGVAYVHDLGIGSNLLMPNASVD